jgi:hypothetical protein
VAKKLDNCEISKSGRTVFQLHGMSSYKPAAASMIPSGWVPGITARR